jgi:monovalent cation:H+ antiporter, CPA1 family
LDAFTTVAVLIFLAAFFGYLNARFLRLPPTIGLMALALAFSLLLNGLHLAGLPVIRPAQRLLGGIDFDQLLFNGLLGYLLFAGALTISLERLAEVRWQVLSLATLGVIGSTIIVGFALFGVLQALGVSLPLSYCLLFGALISPTDPIAVLPIMRRARAPKSLEVLLSGEALFNDGFGVVAFVVVLSLATGVHSGPVAFDGFILFLREAAGGLAFGLALGWLTYRILKTIDDYPVEIIITLALVATGYPAAQALGISGPLAMVVAGIVVGNLGRARGMSARTARNLDRFWEMVDVILNAILFVLIGLEVLVFVEQFSPVRLLAGLIAIPIVLLARLMSVGAPVLLLRPTGVPARRAIPLLTWAGLRGAIPVALALSLPAGEYRELIITMTYLVVVFSILVQGTTVRYLAVGAPRAKERTGKAAESTGPGG